MNKRGFEISISTIVWLIITLVIFSGSIYFIKEFFLKATGFEKQIDSDTRKQIENLIRDGKTVAIPINKKTVNRGTGTTYWLGVQNILSKETPFSIAVEFDKAYDFREREIQAADKGYLESHWILRQADPLVIPQGAFKDTPIYIQAGDRMSDADTTQKGFYVFNVCVFNTTKTYECTPNQLRIHPNVFYTRSLYKLLVEVP